MKKKLLEALQTKFQGVDAQILDRIATKRAEGLTDENQITSIVDGISFQDVLTSYGDFRAGDASISAVKSYEKKYNLKEGKVVESVPTTLNKTTDHNVPDEAPEWAKALIEQNKTMSEKIAAFESKTAQEQRLAQIVEKAKAYNIPESQVKRYNIPDDADLDEYFKDVQQELSNLVFKDARIPDKSGSGVKTDGESIADLIKSETKTIVEQSKTK